MNNEILLDSDSSFIEEVLGGFYKIEKIHTSLFRPTGNSYEVGFVFKSYDRVIKPLTHISGNQIQEGIMEACYLIVGHLIKSGIILDINFEDFLNMRTVAIFREITMKYKKELIFGEEHSLNFTVKNLKDMRGKFSVLEIEFEGFVVGACKSLIKTNDLIDDIL